MIKIMSRSYSNREKKTLIHNNTGSNVKSHDLRKAAPDVFNISNFCRRVNLPRLPKMVISV